MLARVEERDGYRIIRRGDVSIDITPLDCPLCKCVLSDEMDSFSISRSGCCFDCETEVADPNRERWLAGWRPAPHDISEIQARRMSSPHKRAHI
jgi:hypothetical protein